MLLVGLSYLGEFLQSGQIGSFPQPPLARKKKYDSGPQTPPANKHAGSSLPLQIRKGGRWVGKRKEAGAAISRLQDKELSGEE